MLWPTTSHGREIINGIHAPERSFDRYGIADIADLQLRRPIQIVWPRFTGAMHLFRQIIQNTDFIPGRNQFISQMGSNKASPTRN